MEFSSYDQLEDSSKSSSEEIIDNHDNIGTGRSYECVFCKRGFTTAQALGGHMNIHRKDRANNNKAKLNFPSSSSTKVDHHHHIHESSNNINNYASFLTRGSYYSSASSSTLPDQEVDHVNYYNNYYHQLYFPTSHGANKSPSHVQNQRDIPPHLLFGQDHWRQRGLMSLYTNPLCVHENDQDKIIQNNTQEEDHLDLELRLGHHP